MTFQQKLVNQMKISNSLLCVGLDSDLSRIPKRFLLTKHPLLAFNTWIIDQTHESVCSYKLNTAFYESQGSEGWMELNKTVEYIHSTYPGILVILDAKRGDIGSTNEAYALAFFDVMKADAITLHPYTGKEGLQPFLNRKDKGCIILCRTSNIGGDEFQDLDVNGMPLWQVVAAHVRDDWNNNKNCLLVVGATYPQELATLRQMTKDMIFLIPGIGTQGGEIKTTVEAGQDEEGMGILLSASRSIIFSKDPQSAAASLKEEINKYRKRKK